MMKGQFSIRFCPREMRLEKESFFLVYPHFFSFCMSVLLKLERQTLFLHNCILFLFSSLALPDPANDTTYPISSIYSSSQVTVPNNQQPHSAQQHLRAVDLVMLQLHR